MKEIKYSFKYVDECVMCGAGVDHHKVLGKRLNQSQGKNPKDKIGITTTVLKCTVCDLVFSNPQPIPDNINDHYGVAPEDYWRTDYFNTDEDYFIGEITRALELLPFKAGMKALDIGAGLGKAMKALTKAGFDTYGLEPSEQFYTWAIEKHGLPEEKLKLGMMEDIDYPPNSFDLITFGVVLEHVYDPSACLLKALTWLKPDGIIHIEVPSSKWLINKLANTFYKIRLTDYVSNLSPMHNPYHLYEFGLKSFEEHSKKNGYKIAFHEYYVCRTYLPRLFDYFVKPYMKQTNTGMQLCVWLRKP